MYQLTRLEFIEKYYIFDGIEEKVLVELYIDYRTNKKYILNKIVWQDYAFVKEYFEDTINEKDMCIMPHSYEEEKIYGKNPLSDKSWRVEFCGNDFLTEIDVPTCCKTYIYNFNEFWPKFNTMMNKVSNKYGLKDNDYNHYISADNWHVKYNENYDPTGTDKVVAYFEITKGSDSYFELEKTYNRDQHQIFTYEQLYKSVELDEQLQTKREELYANITTKETCKFEYLHIRKKNVLLGNTKYYLNENIESFMERLRYELEKTIDEFVN